jgi:two-component system, OmpR family, sensor histidine kinase MtrB
MSRAAGNGRAPSQARSAAALSATAVDSGARPQPADGPGNGQPSGPLAAVRAFLAAGAGSARLVADRLPPAPRGLLRLARRRAGWAAGLVARRWHRSLQLRVVGTTLVISVAVVAVLGVFLIQQIADGLLNNERAAARTQASTGQISAKNDLNLPGQNTGTTAAQYSLNSLASTLQAGSGPGNSYDVVLLQQGTSSALVGVTGNYLLAPSIPPNLRKVVTREQVLGRTDRLYSLPTTQLSADGKALGPALAVGVPVNGNVQLYYVFRLTQQLQTLQLVQKTLILAGAGLVVLLAVIVSLVTRWVVVPIRQAAQAASRLSAGDLDERMPVRGTDDLAALASSFNEMAASLQDKLGELEDLSHVQRQFVSDVSHELRTPLTTIGLAADVLFGAKEELDPTAQRAAELLRSQLERFEVLLADLLEISRHDANVATLDAESADVCALVLRAAADAEQLAVRRGTRIDFRLPPEPCIAEVDRRRVERILRNLLDNAVEHGEGKDVIVTVAGDRDAVAVSVRDHGCGFSPGEQQRVFERFWRADPARARTTGGTGLGLAIALEDARLHGGWLQAWGERDRGSVFRLTVPRLAGGNFAGSPLPLEPDATEVALTSDVVGVDSVAYPARAAGPGADGVLGGVAGPGQAERGLAGPGQALGGVVGSGQAQPRPPGSPGGPGG